MKTTMHCRICNACNINPIKKRELFVKKGKVYKVYKMLKSYMKNIGTRFSPDKREIREMYYLHYKATKNIYQIVVRCSICNSIMWSDKQFHFAPEQYAEKDGIMVKKEKGCIIQDNEEGLGELYIWHKNKNFIGKKLYECIE